MCFIIKYIYIYLSLAREYAIVKKKKRRSKRSQLNEGENVSAKKLDFPRDVIYIDFTYMSVGYMCVFD